MICKACREGAALYLEGKDAEAEARHRDGCPGLTWCFCAHKKPPTGKIYARS
jgi:hypothetical protein